MSSDVHRILGEYCYHKEDDGAKDDIGKLINESLTSWIKNNKKKLNVNIHDPKTKRILEGI